MFVAFDIKMALVKNDKKRERLFLGALFLILFDFDFFLHINFFSLRIIK